MRTVRDARRAAGRARPRPGARRSAAFGDDRLILERFVAGPAPRRGPGPVRRARRTASTSASATARSSGATRRSSRRRRRRRVDDATRRRLTDAALALGSAVGYVSAGTCEFLLDDRGDVLLPRDEHPAPGRASRSRRLVTGRDLVADQLRIAAGEPLGFEPGRRPRRRATRSRSGSTPRTRRRASCRRPGGSSALRWPAGDGIRVDAGVDGRRRGVAIASTRCSPRSSPTARPRGGARPARRGARRHGRAGARRRTCGSFAGWSGSRRCRAAQARIDTLERIWPPDDWPDRTAIPDDAWRPAARAPRRRLAAQRPTAGRLAADGRRSTSARRATRRTRRRRRELDGDRASVVAGDTAHVDVGGRSGRLPRRARRRTSTAPPGPRRPTAHAGGSADLVAPDAGRGPRRPRRRPATPSRPAIRIVTLEAMKMEHVVAAPSPAAWRRSRVAAGDQVTRGQLLATVEG